MDNNKDFERFIEEDVPASEEEEIKYEGEEPYGYRLPNIDNVGQLNNE